MFAVTVFAALTAAATVVVTRAPAPALIRVRVRRAARR